VSHNWFMIRSAGRECSFGSTKFSRPKNLDLNFDQDRMCFTKLSWDCGENIVATLRGSPLRMLPRRRPWGGTPPYGDLQHDQDEIAKGIAYGKCITGRNCGQ
jgi:hypothetical protein